MIFNEGIVAELNSTAKEQNYTDFSLEIYLWNNVTSTNDTFTLNVNLTFGEGC